MSSSGRSRMRDIRKALKKQNFLVENTNGGHLLAIHPETGVSVPISSTPSDYRGMLNTISQLRRELGFVWKGH